MNRIDIYDAIASSIANLVIKRGNDRVSSGSGFIVGGKLVTCAHVINWSSDLKVEVNFEKPLQGQTGRWEYSNITTAVRGFSDEHSFDFAILEPPPSVKLPEVLHLGEECPKPGEEVLGFGYPFEDPHLTMHGGFVSAVFRSGPATMLKLDMSVNPSNSGGPLIRLSDGAVIGVIARKATGLTKAFGQLQAALQRNISDLQNLNLAGRVLISNIDPVQALIMQQNQMSAVASEIGRSANVGIGYAIWIEAIRSELAWKLPGSLA